MANTIRIKRSTGSSAPGSLENAELAHAEGSDILFLGKGTGGSGGSATTIEKVKFCLNFNIIGNKIKNRIDGIVITIVPNDKSITF